MLMAREELVRRLTEYQDASGIRVVAVFDGKGAKLGDESMPGGIQVFYSASGQTADAVIERLVVKYATEHELTVATDDSMEQQTAISFGAAIVSTAGPRMRLKEAAADLAREIKVHRRKG